MKNKKQLYVWLAAALLALLFLYAGASKLLHPHQLRHDMLNQPIPRWIARMLMWLVPIAEVVIALTLVAELWWERPSMTGLYASFVLMVVFAIYTVLVMTKSLAYVPCSCGGIIRSLTWPQHAVLNLFFTAVSIIGIVYKRKLNKERLET